MHQSLKATMVAGIAAMALPALTGAADAQVVGWNLISAYSCQAYIWTDATGNSTTRLVVRTNTTPSYIAVVQDSVAISALLKFCDDGVSFWGYWDGSPWTGGFVGYGLGSTPILGLTSLYVYPGL
jgi:hypothetical protein